MPGRLAGDAQPGADLRQGEPLGSQPCCPSLAFPVGRASTALTTHCRIPVRRQTGGRRPICWPAPQMVGVELPPEGALPTCGTRYFGLYLCRDWLVSGPTDRLERFRPEADGTRSASWPLP